MAAIVAAVHRIRKREEEVPTAGTGPARPTPDFINRIDKNYDVANKAAAKLGKAYRQKHGESLYMNKDVLGERLALEAELGVGIMRLVLFSLIFVLIIQADLGTAITSEDKRAVSDLFTDTLGLEDFTAITSLEVLREYLPTLSSSLKQYAMTGSARFVDTKAIQVLGPSTHFTYPLPNVALDLAVANGDFSMSAWVDSSGSSASERRSILRKPLASNPALSCWAWNHPSQLRFGAHDFHSLDESPAWEEVVSVDGGAVEGLTHEVLMVVNNTAWFYRNGELLDKMPLPRELTDCGEAGTVELGDAGLTLSSVKFYPRALLASEVKDIFFGGQPLSELATGSSLTKITQDDLGITVSTINAAQTSNHLELDEVKLEAEVASVLEIAAINRRNPSWTDPSFPLDGAPVPVVLDIPIAEEIFKTRKREYAVWEAGGKPRGFERVRTEEWRSDAVGDYWSMFEDPLIWSFDPATQGPFSNGTQLPDGGSGVTGITLSWWYKPTHVDAIHYCGTAVKARNETADENIAYIQSWVEGHWNSLEACVEGHGCVGIAGYTIWFNEEIHRPDISFITSTLTPGRPDGAVVWRHLAMVLDFKDRTLTVYFDGRQFGREAMPESWDASMAELFQDMKLNRQSWGGISECKLAQMRVYPQALTPSDVSEVQELGRWPSGSKMRQCVAGDADVTWGDTVLVDDRGHACEWFNTVRETRPEVCTADAMRQCPLSCDGVRKCYDGSLPHGSLFEPRAPSNATRFRIFDRAMHLKPRNASHSIICPGRQVAAKRQALRQECEARQEELREMPKLCCEYFHSFTTGTGREEDLRECEQLFDNLDPEQCTWDDSWVPQFVAQYQQSRAFSVQFWVRARPGSFGMPHNFWPGVRFLSRLVSPLVLLAMGEEFKEESLWIYRYTTANRPTPEDGSETVLPVTEDEPMSDTTRMRPTTDVKYTTEWTFVHWSVEEMGADLRVCAGMNARSPTENDGGFCKDYANKGLMTPEQFLEALEFRTELLVSPIEVIARSFTYSEVQRAYYSKCPYMVRVTGPATSELARLETVAEGNVKEVQNYDQRVSLLAPPLLFQSRAEATSCASSVTTPFLEAQWDLAQAAHCPNAVSCPGVSSSKDLSNCLGDPLQTSYYGLQPSELAGRVGFADFLFTLDSDAVVRGGEVLETREFLDSQTTYFSVQVVLQLPANGLVSVLELSGDVSGVSVQPEARFQHLGFVESGELGGVRLAYIAVIVCIALVVLLNLTTFVTMFSEKRRFDVPIDNQELLDIVWDAMMVVLLITFCCLSMVAIGKSEDQAREVTEAVARVPFADPTIAFQDKVATFFAGMDELAAVLAKEKARGTFAFAIMVLMLVRILKATAVHPRVGVLVATIQAGFNDLWHFALLFILLFIFFCYIATWLFAESRQDFADLEKSMETQFYMLLGSMPEGDWRGDQRLIVYVVFTNVIQFFLMLNFLLAIVVEAYMKCREAIESNQSDNEFFYDVYLTATAAITGLMRRWPSRRALAYILRNKIASTKITVRHLEAQHLPYNVCRTMAVHYRAMEAIAEEAPGAKQRRALRFSIPESPNRRASVQDMPVTSGPVTAQPAIWADLVRPINPEKADLPAAPPLMTAPMQPPAIDAAGVMFGHA